MNKTDNKILFVLPLPTYPLKKIYCILMRNFIVCGRNFSRFPVLSKKFGSTRDIAPDLPETS